jgi:prepilin-type processing-associated H-X9-DG protein
MAKKNGNALSGNVASNLRGTRYLDALILYTGFVTIMPPNSPTCTLNSTEQIWGLFTATSNHTGGVNCGFADGSVRFVNDAVDTGGLPNAPQGSALTGESPYGVWGALGTPEGGESKSP